MCADLSNRGVADVLIVCCDGLTGFAEAIEATWPQATVQTCVVHLIRAAMRFVAYGDRKQVAAALKPIYQASSAEAALDALDAFADSVPGRKYPSAVKSFRDAWERFTLFLAFPPELRRVIYTTNSIESLNYQLRKVTKTAGTSQRRRRGETAVDGHLQHRRQTRPRPRQRERTTRQQTPRRPPDRRRCHHQLETSIGATLTSIYPERINQHL